MEQLLTVSGVNNLAKQGRARPRVNLKRAIYSYGLAVGSVAISSGVALLEESAGLPHGQLSLFLLGFTITTWYGGIGPGILNFILGSTAFNFFFTPPLWTLGFTHQDLAYYIVFLVFAFLIGSFTTIRKTMEVDLRRSRDQLADEVRQRGMLNGELERRSRQLEASNKELEAFAYSVSHDLRAPVRHIAGFTELLQKHANPVLDDTSRRHITTVLDSANRMGNLIDDLLAFSRIGRTETQKTTVRLESLVEEVVKQNTQETQDRNLSWRIGTLPACYGDPAMLRLVFGNLISNAVKFTRTREKAEIEIGSMNHQPNEVVVFIKDNGVGFDMKYRDKVFGVFQRLHSQEAFEGTGIGLATVERVVHRHGGRVWAESSVDHGATFFVALPKSER
jgi:signal transduction histidine kinase